MLITKGGVLKLADFGLSRFVQLNGKAEYTNKVITRWYRPPELFLGATEYGPAVDMWSVGCILGELLVQAAILPGKSETEQLDKIFELCGTPTNETWPDALKTKAWSRSPPAKMYKRCIKERFKGCPAGAVDLLDKLLTLDPKLRPSASECLNHDWLWQEPLPKKPDEYVLIFAELL